MMRLGEWLITMPLVVAFGYVFLRSGVDISTDAYMAVLGIVLGWWGRGRVPPKPEVPAGTTTVTTPASSSVTTGPTAP